MHRICVKLTLAEKKQLNMRTVKYAGLISNFLSIACCFHCLALPLLIGILPVTGVIFLRDPKTEILFLLCQIAFCFFSLCFGFRKHNKLTPAIAAIIGIFALYYQHSFKYHLLLSSFAAICFISSNLLNRKLCKSCSHCQH
jgi:hypothetical protein